MSMPLFLVPSKPRMMLPEAGITNFAADAVVRCCDMSGDVGVPGAGCAAGVTFSSGSGLAAEGGGGVGVPVPGWVNGSAGAPPSSTTGISRYCPSRTARSGPSPFHSASDLAETL